MKTKRIAVLASIAGVVVAAGVLGPWLYINVIRDEAPERLSLTTTTVSSETSVDSPDAEGVSGDWTLAPTSQVGYRVKEILFGQSTEGVGRTSDIQGSLSIDGDVLVGAEFTVQMASLESDDSRRDGKFRGEIMDTDRFPTAVFSLAESIVIPPAALVGETFTTDAMGDLTLRGTTRRVAVELEARLSGSTIEVAGAINIVFADWAIPNPSNPAITTEDNGDLEFLLVFSRG